MLIAQNRRNVNERIVPWYVESKFFVSEIFRAGQSGLKIDQKYWAFAVDKRKIRLKI